MNIKAFQAELDARVARYNLLTHPFHRAWSTGKLSPHHLRAHALEYFHLVAAYPTFLSALHSRLSDGALRRAVLRNLAEEEVEGRAQSDMWLDFAEGFGLTPERVRRSQPSPAVRNMIDRFYRCARQDAPAQVLSTFYAYESQAPRISGEKACALLRYYGATDRTCGYFALHTYSDALHSQVWREQILCLVSDDGQFADAALDAAGRAAYWLWQGLDASHAYRLSEHIPLAA